jgi:hypothetical protein
MRGIRHGLRQACDFSTTSVEYYFSYCVIKIECFCLLIFNPLCSAAVAASNVSRAGRKTCDRADEICGADQRRGTRARDQGKQSRAFDRGSDRVIVLPEMAVPITSGRRKGCPYAPPVIFRKASSTLAPPVAATSFCGVESASTLPLCMTMTRSAPATSSTR